MQTDKKPVPRPNAAATGRRVVIAAFNRQTTEHRATVEALQAEITRLTEQRRREAVDRQASYMTWCLSVVALYFGAGIGSDHLIDSIGKLGVEFADLLAAAPNAGRRTFIHRRYLDAVRAAVEIDCALADVRPPTDAQVSAFLGDLRFSNHAIAAVSGTCEFAIGTAYDPELSDPLGLSTEAA